MTFGDLTGIAYSGLPRHCWHDSASPTRSTLVQGLLPK
jgi:hypothetical protein